MAQRGVAHCGDRHTGRDFLEDNKATPGVTTLASGLQYRVLVEGGGVEHPLESTPCECHYAGRLLDGTEFDSSYKRGTPSTFAPNQVIKGWTEAMQVWPSNQHHAPPANPHHVRRLLLTEVGSSPCEHS